MEINENIKRDSFGNVYKVVETGEANKLDQNQFALLPVTQEDLQNSLFGRHFWLNIKGSSLYNASGISAIQKVKKDDQVSVEAGFLYHKTIRENN